MNIFVRPMSNFVDPTGSADVPAVFRPDGFYDIQRKTVDFAGKNYLWYNPCSLRIKSISFGLKSVFTLKVNELGP